MNYLLGIDVGTTGLKSALFDFSGEPVSVASRDYPTQTPGSGCSEQQPERWWDAAQEAINSAISDVDPGKIVGIGLCGQMHTAALLDSDGNVLRPAITWMDQRSKSEVEKLRSRLGPEKLRTITANFPTTTYTLPHLLWLKQNEPASFRNIDKVLLAKDYVKYRLTGEINTEVSDASGTYILDYAEQDWSEELLEYLGLSRDELPNITGSAEKIGEVNLSAARETGLKEGTPVVAGAADQAAGALGVGSIKEGQVNSLIGTAGVVSACTKDPQPDPEERVLCWSHAVPDTWQVLGVMQTAGASLKWFREALECPESKEETEVYERYNREAEEVPAGSNGLLFLPYLQGERTPHWDPDARGVFFGISQEHDRKHFIRSIMEGVGFGIKDSLEIIEEMNVAVTELRACGGGYRGSTWRQIVSDITGVKLKYPDVSEGSALGAALLAGVGTGVYSGVEEAVEKVVSVRKTVTPNPASNLPYSDLYNIYRELYRKNQDLFSELHERVSS
ncbi:xylulokinase [Candidatus Bipolaricaulota bacterium]|nr:xylulokinase [Candidatus Bipolaricaulota bacterium]